MAKHRGHNEGTIYERTYEGKNDTSKRFVALLPMDEQGKRPSLGSFRTRAEAREALQQAAVARAQGTLVQGKSPTVKQWFQTWLAGRTRIAYQTRAGYELTLKTVSSYIGCLRLDQLTEQHLGEMWRKLADGVAADGSTRQPLAATTLATHHAHLSGALRAAVKSRHVSLTYNPADEARPERGERKEINPLTEDEVRRLFAATHDDPEYPIWVTLMTTGCRAGECRALRWRDIDFARRTVSISGSVHREKGLGWVRGPTKTKRSRVVTLRPETVSALKAHRPRQTEMRLAAGPVWCDLDYVFTDELGHAVNKGLLQRRFTEACRKAGIPRRMMKETRHTFATLGLVRNVPVKVISDALGHTTVKMTYDIYSHVIVGVQEDSLSHLDRLFN
jgi:integrase